MKRYRRQFDEEEIECSRDSLAFEILSSKFPHVGKAEIRDVLAGCAYDEDLAETNLSAVYGAVKRQKVDLLQPFQAVAKSQSQTKLKWEEYKPEVKRVAKASFGEALPLAGDLLDMLREQQEQGSHESGDEAQSEEQNKMIQEDEQDYSHDSNAPRDVNNEAAMLKEIFPQLEAKMIENIVKAVASIDMAFHHLSECCEERHSVKQIEDDIDDEDEEQKDDRETNRETLESIAQQINGSPTPDEQEQEQEEEEEKELTNDEVIEMYLDFIDEKGGDQNKERSLEEMKGFKKILYKFLDKIAATECERLFQRIKKTQDTVEMMKSLSTEAIEEPLKKLRYKTNHVYESQALEELKPKYTSMPEGVPQDLYDMFQDVDLVTDLVDITFSAQSLDATPSGPDDK